MRLPVFVDANLLGQTPHGVAHLPGAGCKQQHHQDNYCSGLSADATGAITALSSFNTGYSVANTWYNSWR